MTVGQAIAAHEPAPSPACWEQHLKDERLDEVMALYGKSIRRLIGQRIYDRFEMHLLSSVADAVAALRRHGIGDDGSHADLAARHALAQIDQRCGSTGPFRVLRDERAALDELLRVHEQQLLDERLAALLLTQAIASQRRTETMRNQAPLAESGANG